MSWCLKADICSKPIKQKKGHAKNKIQQQLQTQLTFGWFEIAYDDESCISQLNIVSHIQNDEFLSIPSQISLVSQSGSENSVKTFLNGTQIHLNFWFQRSISFIETNQLKRLGFLSCFLVLFLPSALLEVARIHKHVFGCFSWTSFQKKTWHTATTTKKTSKNQL